MNENEKDLPEEEIEEETTEEYTEEVEETDEEAYTDDEEYTEEENDSEDEEEDGAEDGAEDGEESEPEKEVKPEPPKTEEAKKVETREDKQYKSLLKHMRRALESMGIKTSSDEEAIEEIIKLAAEQKGQTVEEYEKDSDDEDEFLEFKRQKEKLYWDDRFKKDLEAIQSAYPEAKKYTHLSQLPNWKKFGKLMEEGETAVEAFRQSHPKDVEASIAAGVRQSLLNDTKAHLHSSKPKPASGGAIHISKSEMDTYRDMFPDLSDAEIRKYYAKATKK